ncbi:aminotransferase class I/II-fold pyridoxal phosphate-dependent enzyme [Sinorhizobium meliloti]|uniref:aminotransferase class I/II-fold pyridoxal phosphate-dependent enzyme n=1 Tax=Rhizobium meliloti TaxID=382 RepID=UPI000424E408|nr:aminotransferase class I/II-fold pyridoxal phosphate-dependent enzyme [Sinorhizobium meliloti]
MIYVGTFSKVLFPSLRIGYLVLPHDLVNHFVAAKSISDRHVASLEQAALTEFLTEGHFTAHLRRMRKIYSERQYLLLEVAEKYWQQFMTVEASFGGLLMLGKLRQGLDDVEVSIRAAERGVRLRPLSPLYLEEPAQHGFLLGFAAYSEKEMAIAAKRLLEPRHQCDTARRGLSRSPLRRESTRNGG